MTHINNKAPLRQPQDSQLRNERSREWHTALRIACAVMLGIFFYGSSATLAAEPEAAIDDNKSCIQCHAKSGSQQLAATGAHGPQRIGCTHCHAPNSEDPSSKLEKHAGSLLLFRDNDQLNAEKQNAVCLGCHDDSQRLHWQNSTHASSDLACTDCHTVHGTDPVLEASTEAEVCYRCHASVRSRMLMPNSHPVRDGQMSCRDCHQAHGSAGPTQLSGLSVTESCTECHAEKRGPFLWEHSPVSEDCTLCHDPHGAIHPGMLTRRPPQLCQSCHQPSGEFAARHARRALEYYPPGDSEDEVNRLVLGESCLNCHSQVHGSNHPSGAGLMR